MIVFAFAVTLAAPASTSTTGCTSSRGLGLGLAPTLADRWLLLPEAWGAGSLPEAAPLPLLLPCRLLPAASSPLAVCLAVLCPLRQPPMACRVRPVV